MDRLAGDVGRRGCVDGPERPVEPSPITARMGTFTSPDGVSSFALSMKPTAVAPTTAARDIVVLFNTSASQTGEYRAKAIDALKGFLAGLNAGDRVRLVAVDLNAIPLSKTFVAPNSKEMAAALAALDARVPLGATDMAKAVEAVVDSYGGESKNAQGGGLHRRRPQRRASAGSRRVREAVRAVGRPAHSAEQLCGGRASRSAIARSAGGAERRHGDRRKRNAGPGSGTFVGDVRPTRRCCGRRRSRGRPK